MNTTSSNQNLIDAWHELLSAPISTDEQLLDLKRLAGEMYQQGLFRQIVADLDKSNLKAVFISALLKNYQFTPENHIYLELASHLLMFNKSADILFAQDGEHYDQFPSQASIQSMLEKYGQQTDRDSFYLTFTSSSQVIYFNKLTNEAKVFICPHAGWGIYDYPRDHIFSVLLYRRIAHIDALVDIPEINLPEKPNLRDRQQLEQAINDGSLFLGLYCAYFQQNVDNGKELYAFERKIDYTGHYYKSYPQALNGNRRDGLLVEFMDYLQEELFPVKDNHIYNAMAEDRSPILLPKAHYQTALDRENVPPFKLTRVIAHEHYDDEYVAINTKQQLLSFMAKNISKLDYNDYNQTILERLDYGYLYNLLSNNGVDLLEDILDSAKADYADHESYDEIEQQIINVYNTGKKQVLCEQLQTKLSDAVKIFKTELKAKLSLCDSGDGDFDNRIASFYQDLDKIVLAHFDNNNENYQSKSIDYLQSDDFKSLVTNQVKSAIINEANEHFPKEFDMLSLIQNVLLAALSLVGVGAVIGYYNHKNNGRYFFSMQTNTQQHDAIDESLDQTMPNFNS